jgi:Polyketide cyclase / dehydrase and lipid transport
MATICVEVRVAVDAHSVWDAIRDVGNAHLRLFRGVLTSVELTNDGRVVTFANGLVVNEPTVDINEEMRRYAWTSSGALTTHYNSSLQVFEESGGGSRIVWTTDVLPNDVRAVVAGLMEAGAAAMEATLTAT